MLSPIPEPTLGFHIRGWQFRGGWAGHIVSGVQDVNSLVNGISTEQQISGTAIPMWSELTDAAPL